jgi:ribonuclease BN (tRNA processing enzyme)
MASGSPCRLEDAEEYALLDQPNWRVQGHSNAGERTGYFIHGVNVVVDCGLSTWRTPTALFLTHRHTDHSMELPAMVSYRTVPRKGQEGLLGRPVVMPPECVKMIAHLCASIAYLSDGVLPASDEAALKRIGIHPITAAPSCGYPAAAAFAARDSTYDEAARVPPPPPSAPTFLEVPGLPDIRVEVLPGYHLDCQSNAYGFCEVRRKLGPAYQGLEGKELKALRAQGVDLMVETLVPHLLIFGDTTPDALLNHTEWQKYKNVFIECTACQETGLAKEAVADEVASRRRRGHTHAAELLPILEKMQAGRRWFIQHTSLATKASTFDALLKTFPGLTDCVVVRDRPREGRKETHTDASAALAPPRRPC